MGSPEYAGAAASGEALAEKTSRLLDQQLDLALGVSGFIGPENAEAIWSLACAYRELAREDM